MLPGLWAAGHRAFAVTLSGVGERAHIDPASVTLDTHIADVANVIEAEELTSAILVGHSYAGVVVTGVAQRLAERLRHLVYLDGVVPHPGESWSAGQAPETRAARRRVIAEQGVLPPPDPAIFGLEGPTPNGPRAGRRRIPAGPTTCRSISIPRASPRSRERSSAARRRN